MGDIDAGTLARRLEDGEAYALLDVREPWEWEICRLAGALLIPLNELPARLTEVPAGRPLVVLCHHGVRSRYAQAFLHARGYDGIINLEGGIAAWAEQVDPTMATY